MSNPKAPPARVGKALSSILSSPRVAPEPAAAEAFSELAGAEAFAPVNHVPTSSPPEMPPSHVARPGARLNPEAVSEPDVPGGAASRTNDPATVAPVPVRHLTLESRPEPSDEPSAADRAPAEQGSARKRETFLISAALADEMRDAIVHLQGPPRFLSLASFGEEAIRAYLDVLKTEHSGGQPFPKRPHAVRQGRPLR